MKKNSKASFLTFVFILIQYIFVLYVFIFLTFDLIKENDFVNKLLFYLLVFILPIFLFIAFAYKQNPFVYINIHIKNVYIGIISAIAMTLIFSFSHSFRLDLPQQISILILGLLGAFLAGVFEEIVFRGFYLKVIYEKLGFIKANILVSLMFAALHFKQIYSIGPIQIVMLFVFSLFLGYLYKDTDSLLNTIIVHTAYNILFVLF